MPLLAPPKLSSAPADNTCCQRCGTTFGAAKTPMPAFRSSSVTPNKMLACSEGCQCCERCWAACNDAGAPRSDTDVHAITLCPHCKRIM